MKKIFTCLCIAALCFCKTATLSAQVNLQDSLALVNLYDSTNGPGWKNHTNWLTAAPVSTWHGIRLSNGRVTKIDLNHNNLVGHIPVSLGNLSNLRYLYLFHNQLTGSIPSSLGNLSNLQYLYLYSNQLSGSIPSSFGNLSNVQYLYLYSNQLSGSIPSSLGNLSNLIALYLHFNQLTGNIPLSMGKLSNLQYLYLNNNQLSGNIPQSLSNLLNLLQLFLHANQLSGSIPSSLGKLSNLQYLYLTSNHFIGGIPSSLGKLSNLQGLFLAYDQLSGSIPSSLSKLSHLQYLYLQNNNLSGSIPSSLGKLSNLTDLYLNNNQLSNSLPSSLGKLSNLIYLYLNNNQLSGTIPSSLDSLHAYTYIYYNKFTFAGMEGLAERSTYTVYDPQANIPVIQNNDTLSVDAGGTLNNNTYKWYKDGVLVKTKTGNQRFNTTGTGKYNVVVTNAIATALTLYSDTITIPGFAAVKNVTNKTNANTFVYPNPANNFIHLTLDKPATSNTTIVLYNMQGDATMQQKVAAGTITQQYSISNLAPGNYLFIIMENGKKIHEERLVIVR